MDFEKAFKRIKILKKRNPEAQEILELYHNILEFQRSKMEGGDLPVSFSSNYPLLQVLEEIEEEFLSETFADFFEFISLFGTPKMKEGAQEAAESEHFKPSRVKETLLNFIKKEEVVPGIPPEFTRLSILSVAPIFFSPLSNKLKEKLHEDFESVNCPYCGFRGQVGFLSKEEEGKRYLICPVCYGEWPIKRDRCAFCGKEDLEEHYYLLPEGEDNYLRLEVCEECKHYIKTVDERVLEEKGELCVPVVEDLATPHLDIKALELGYKKTTPNLFGF